MITWIFLVMMQRVLDLPPPLPSPPKSTLSPFCCYNISYNSPKHENKTTILYIHEKLLFWVIDIMIKRSGYICQNIEGMPARGGATYIKSCPHPPLSQNSEKKEERKWFRNEWKLDKREVVLGGTRSTKLHLLHHFISKSCSERGGGSRPAAT